MPLPHAVTTPPMAQNPNNPEAFSKDTYSIASIDTHVYNASALEPYLASFAQQARQNSYSRAYKEAPINVIYLLHGRGSTYKSTEMVAYKVLEQFYAKKGTQEPQVPLIAVTFDLRNHGSRLLYEQKNLDWKRGNDTHGVDMVSSIRGIVEDLKVTMDFLPAYLDLERHLDKELRKVLDTKITHTNIVLGYSLGAHAAIRFAHKYPELVAVVNPVIGCFNLSSLLVERLRQVPALDKKWFYFNYLELDLTQEQQRHYPEALHTLLSLEDTDIFEKFPFGVVKLFFSFGAEDKLVPPEYSRLWVDLGLSSNSDSASFVQEKTGHNVTMEMIDAFTTWLVEQV